MTRYGHWAGAGIVALCGLAVRLRAQDTSAHVIPAVTSSDLIRQHARVRDAVLGRTISLRLEHVTLERALEAIAVAARTPIGYSGTYVPVAKIVSLVVDTITVGEALGLLLRGTDVGVAVSPTGRLSLERSTPTTGAATIQSQQQATGTIVGRVTDAATGDGLVGVNLAVIGRPLRTSTALDGSYTFRKIPVGAQVLTYTHLGYTARRHGVEVTVDSTVHADIAMVRSPQVLDQVVTTVTGESDRQRVGYSVTTIGADSVVRRTAVDGLSDVLSSRVPGLQVFNDGGLTGASPQMALRGLGAVGASDQPLLYVDGVRVDNGSASFIGGPGGGSAPGSFNDIPPEDIESIQVVKGPAAATLYGTDAANGVILISTKRGQLGRPQWNASGEFGTLSINRKIFPFEYTAWGHTPGSTAAVPCPLQSVAADTCIQDSITHFSPLRVASLSPFQTGYRNDYSLQLSGGSGTRYFLSGSYTDESGYLEMPAADRAVLEAQRGGSGVSTTELRPNAHQKKGLRANLVTPITPDMDISLSSAFLENDARIPNSTFWNLALYGNGYRDSTNGWLPGYRSFDYFVDENETKVRHFTAAPAFQWRPRSWLLAHATAGADVTEQGIASTQPVGTPLNPAGASYSNQGESVLYSVDIGTTASARPMRDLVSRTAAGAQYNRRQVSSTFASGQGLTPGSELVNGAQSVSGGQNVGASVVAGAYAEENLEWRSSWFATVGLRADGASAFGTAFRTAIYPKESLSWVVSSERWWPPALPLSSLRLRVAYGASGVQPSATDALSLEQPATVFVGGSTATAIRLTQVANPRLRPERRHEFETGIDAELFAGRVRLEGTYYDKRSLDAIEAINLGASADLVSEYVNVGSVRNWGYEGSISISPIDSRPFTWNVGLNGSTNHNQLVTLGPGVQPSYGSFGYPSLVVGYSLYSNFAQPIVKYADANHNGIIEPSEVTIGAQQQFAGPAFPEVQLSGSTSIDLMNKRLHMAAVVDYRGAFDLVDETDAGRCLYSQNCLAAVDRHAALSDQAANAGYADGTLWGYIEDASFARLREASLSYELPPATVRRMHLHAMIITVAGRNLALWTKYRGIDPEVVQSTGDLSQGPYSDGGLPVSRYVIGKVNLGF